jgi:hypothetical protein
VETVLVEEFVACGDELVAGCCLHLWD